MKKIKVPANYGTKQCEECGTSFVKNAPNSKYCCAECKKKAYDRLQKKYQDALTAARRNGGDRWKECRFCGKLFFPENPWKAYCSEDCRKDAQRARSLRRQVTLPKANAQDLSREGFPSSPKEAYDGFTWEEVLQCMKENSCQYVRAVEILKQKKGD